MAVQCFQCNPDVQSFSHQIFQKSQQELLLKKLHVKSNIGKEQQILRQERLEKNILSTTTKITDNHYCGLLSNAKIGIFENEHFFKNNDLQFQDSGK